MMRPYGQQPKPTAEQKGPAGQSTRYYIRIDPLVVVVQQHFLVKKTLRKFFSPFFQMNIYDFSSILQQHNIVLIIRGPPAAALQDGLEKIFPVVEIIIKMLSHFICVAAPALSSPQHTK
jgi:hypothetical protein